MKRFGLALALAVALVATGLVSAAEAPEGAEFMAPDEVPQRLIRVLRTTNKAQINRYVPKVYDFENVNPFAVLRFIRRSMEIEEGGWFLFGKPDDPDDPDSIRSGKVVVIAPIYQIPYIDQLMEAIDVEGLTSSSGSDLLYYRPKHRHSSDPFFVQLVETVMAPNASEGNQFPDTEVNGFLLYSSPGHIEDVRRWLPILDQAPPQVMVEATLYEVNVENDDALGLDYFSWKNGPGRNLFSLGAYYQRQGAEGISSGATDPFDDGLIPTDREGAFDSYGGFYSYFIDFPAAFFDFLVTKQKARVLASAKLLTRNSMPAFLETGERISFPRRSVCYGFRDVVETIRADDVHPGFFEEGLDDDHLFDEDSEDGHRLIGIDTEGRERGLSSGQAMFVLTDSEGVLVELDEDLLDELDIDDVDLFSDFSGFADVSLGSDFAGVKLAILPLIGEEGVNLDVTLNIVSHTGFDTLGRPQLNGRLYETSLRVLDGQEVVLGGYTREIMVQQANKIPILGSIPGVGWLFGGEQNLIKRRRVVLVLTAHVVTDYSAMGGEGTEIDAALIRARARREVPVDLFETEYGFDMRGLDPELEE